MERQLAAALSKSAPPAPPTPDVPVAPSPTAEPSEPAATPPNTARNTRLAAEERVTTFQAELEEAKQVHFESEVKRASDSACTDQPAAAQRV